MSIEIWIGFLAFVLMMLGAGVSIHPPERRELKIALFCAFGVTGVSLLVLTFVQAGDRSSEQRQAAAAQLRLQESADQNRQELGKVKSQLGEIQKIASQPGSPDERLDSALEGISKVLGQKSVTGFSRSSPASPVAPLSFLREIPLKGGPAQRLNPYLDPNSP